MQDTPFNWYRVKQQHMSWKKQQLVAARSFLRSFIKFGPPLFGRLEGLRPKRVWPFSGIVDKDHTTDLWIEHRPQASKPVCTAYSIRGLSHRLGRVGGMVFPTRTNTRFQNPTPLARKGAITRIVHRQPKTASLKLASQFVQGTKKALKLTYIPKLHKKLLLWKVVAWWKFDELPHRTNQTFNKDRTAFHATTKHQQKRKTGCQKKSQDRRLK